MSHPLTIELREELYETIRREAEASGTSPAAVAATTLEERFGVAPAGDTTASESLRQAARTRFEQHFGEVDLGHPLGTDNDGIDADLAREYACTHERA